MNIVMKILYASVEAVTITIVATLPLQLTTPNLILWAWYGLCILLGFVLRLGVERNEKRLTKETLLFHSIATVTWCFFASLVWNYFFLPEKKGFEIFIFLNSLFAAFMVGQFKVIFEIGVKKWLQIKLGKFLAVEEKEVKP